MIIYVSIKIGCMMVWVGKIVYFFTMRCRKFTVNISTPDNFSALWSLYHLFVLCNPDQIVLILNFFNPEKLRVVLLNKFFNYFCIFMECLDLHTITGLYFLEDGRAENFSCLIATFLAFLTRFSWKKFWTLLLKNVQNIFIKFFSIQLKASLCS